MLPKKVIKTVANFFWFFPFLMLAAALNSFGQTSLGTITRFSIDARVPAPVPETGYFEMGSNTAGKSPDGHILSVNNRYLMMDGTPWLPVMGEFHYSRYPEKFWEEEIVKMKAGGVQIVSTYIFWIHHEEVEGRFDWSGQRDLRAFVELCAKHGMYVYPRIGPWAHGEVRNGGFPDWLLAKGATRVNESVYLSYVSTLYKEIGNQLKGLLWKEGGPVIGIQIENEYANRDQNGGAAHISKLKKMAIEAGLDVPLYTVTGWDNAVYPLQEVIPVFGGYPDEPWSGSIQELKPDPEGVFQFHVSTPVGTAGIMQGLVGKPQGVDLAHYPKFTAEVGGGMELTYHRRVVISGDDIASMALTALGSGVNLLGYYMYHGGANPEGKLTTLQESQATDYPNDVPVVSYDFQAPLREFGQMNESFRRLKLLHQFVQDFGEELAPMSALLPDHVPYGPRDTSTLRLAARFYENSGYLFFSNYLRNYPLPIQHNIQAIVKLASETIAVPKEAVTIPLQSFFVWPINMNLDGALLKYATAQPYAKIDNGKTAFYFFTPAMGIEPEFVFARSTVESLQSTTGLVSRADNQIYVNKAVPSTSAAMELITQSGKKVCIVLLSREDACNSWKMKIGKRDHILITSSGVFVDGDTVHLRSRTANGFSVLIFPDDGQNTVSAAHLQKVGDDGLFARYIGSVEPVRLPVAVEQVHEAFPSSPVKMGKAVDWRPGPVATPPDDSVFARAGVWRITLPGKMPANVSDVFLSINYVGDIGRLYNGLHLWDDNFFNGTTWEVGLKRFGAEAWNRQLELRILPLRADAPIYLPKSSWPAFEGKNEIAEVKEILVFPEYEVKLAIFPSTSDASTPEK